jgi:hypothetical protein
MKRAFSLLGLLWILSVAASFMVGVSWRDSRVQTARADTTRAVHAPPAFLREENARGNCTNGCHPQLYSMPVSRSRIDRTLPDLLKLLPAAGSKPQIPIGNSK